MGAASSSGAASPGGPTPGGARWSGRAAAVAAPIAARAWRPIAPPRRPRDSQRMISKGARSGTCRALPEARWRFNLERYRGNTCRHWSCYLNNWI
eukprot:2805131-Pyramimonas_sp.AAC.1